MTSLLEDLLDSELANNNIRITTEKVYEIVRGDIQTYKEGLARSKTLGTAKSLLEFYDLVRQAIEDYERRAGTPEVNQIRFTEEEPDVDAKTETITFSLVSREPGAFQQGAPMEARVKNMRPMLREEAVDEENPDYRKAIMGYWHDNIVRFTCWARTNKTANARAMWFEDLMDEYAWWFKLQGVSRVLFWQRNTDIVAKVGGNKWYGRPIDYFVRTEKIQVFTEKTIEEIIVRMMTKKEL